MKVTTLTIHPRRIRTRAVIASAIVALGLAVPIAFFPDASYSDVYSCSPSEPTCVTNFNRERFNAEKTVNVYRVTVDGRDTPSLGEIKSNIRQLDAFYRTASRGQFSLKLVGERNVAVTSHSCTKAKSQAMAQTNDSAFLNVYVMPHGVCNGSNAGGRRIFLNGSLFRDYAHETGHILGLAHGNRNVNGFDPYGDATTYMGSMPSDNYNIPQLHWLGWTKKDEVVGVNHAVDDGGSIEVTLRPVDRNAASASPNALAAVYEIPGTETRLWIAMPKSHDTNVNQIGGGELFVYRAPKCRGCSGISMGTTYFERFGSKTSKDHVVAGGITVNPIRYESSMIRIDGKNVEKYESVTLRITKS